MSEPEEEMRYDWLFFMADNKNERVVISYWAGRPLGENFAIFWGVGTILEHQHDLGVAADVTSDGGIYATIFWEGGERIISVNAGEYLTQHVWIDGRMMLRFESWTCGFLLPPNESRMMVNVSSAPKPKRK